MFSRKKHLVIWTILLFVSLIVSGCNLFLGPGDSITATPTPTTPPGGDLEQPKEPTNLCEGLAGTLELQLLVGPSEAVGLTPFTFATIPFTTISEGEVHLVQGNGATEYYEDVLEAEWGSYTVQFEGETTVSGTCVADGPSGILNVYVQMDGEQMVVIVVEGVEHTYPWVGTPLITASFPIEEDALVEGEGWMLVLHID